MSPTGVVQTGPMTSESKARHSSVDGADFETKLAELTMPLRRAVLAAYGPTVVDDICADTVAWAWEHRSRLVGMSNPGGYLYRVAQSAARRYRARALPVWLESEAPPVGVDLDLVAALVKLPARQRAAVVLVHGHGLTLATAAAELGCSVSSLRNHLARGLARLKSLIGDPE